MEGKTQCLKAGLQGWEGHFMLGQLQQEVGSKVRTDSLGMLVEEGAP